MSRFFHWKTGSCVYLYATAGGVRFILIRWLVFAISISMSAQPTPKKSTSSSAKPDTWQRSKECAAQAEKTLAERNARSVSFGGRGADWWSNHYSPKYNRCFVRFDYIVDVKNGVKGGPSTSSYLVDAFERTDVAESSGGVSASFLCRNEDNPAECEKIAALAWVCSTEGRDTDCKTAKDFISEHMKN